MNEKIVRLSNGIVIYVSYGKKFDTVIINTAPTPFDIRREKRHQLLKIFSEYSDCFEVYSHGGVLFEVKNSDVFALVEKIIPFLTDCPNLINIETKFADTHPYLRRKYLALLRN